jgi:hypothetical protein
VTETSPQERASALLRATSDRQVAALEAAELVEKHDLTFAPIPEEDRRRARAARLAEKLLRTAAASGGASENERRIAAQHAADLFVEHKLEFVAAPKKRRWPRLPPQPVIITAGKRQCRPERTPFAQWKSAIVDEPTYCIQCGYLIHEGEIAWFDAWYGYIHSNITVG